jgi:ATP-dependent Clp protease ATP-binding subunit ClpA
LKEVSSIFERFTERARQVVVLANDEARIFYADKVDSTHLLAGLIREEEGIAARVLIDIGPSLEFVRGKMTMGTPPDNRKNTDDYFGRQLAYTPDAKKVLELALREALSLGHNYIGTEHILLGLVRSPDVSKGQMILFSDGRTVEEVRECVMERLRPKKVAESVTDAAKTYGLDTNVAEDLKVLIHSFVDTPPQEDDPPEDSEYAEIEDLKDAILRALGWFAVDDYYMAYETLVSAVRPYAD